MHHVEIYRATQSSQPNDSDEDLERSSEYARRGYYRGNVELIVDEDRAVQGGRVCLKVDIDLALGETHAQHSRSVRRP